MSGYIIRSLINYGIKQKLIQIQDISYIRNKLLNYFGETWYDERALDFAEIEDINDFLEDVISKNLAQRYKLNFGYEKDKMKNELLDFFLEKPSKVNKIFWNNYQQSPKKATLDFYRYCQKANYIKKTEKNKKWQYLHDFYGIFEITVNLAKPEKDPKEIAESLHQEKESKKKYPRCQLCVSNTGYVGTINHPSRSNLRLIELELSGEQWFLQYSPYSYYSEHAIILSAKHEPMKINMQTFRNLFAFIDKFPHYFIGSNADLPIVGGSILDHNHFQAGKYEFPLMRAKSYYTFSYNEIEGSLLEWPVSVIRLKSKNQEQLLAYIWKLFVFWQGYNDVSLNILSHSGTTPHNTITPIVRKKDNDYEVYLALRNNRTSEEYPDGIFHPHPRWHHVKRENIGLIEVMGLAILPPRVQKNIEEAFAILWNKSSEQHPYLFDDRRDYLLLNQQQIIEKLQDDVGNVFVHVLEDTAVFKKKNDFIHFIKQVEMIK